MADSHWLYILLVGFSVIKSQSQAVPCTASLGMENRLIKDAQITASSEWDSNHAAIQGRLNFKEGGGKQGGWSARYNDANQWIQVALGGYTKLTGIATQGRNGGRHRQWVTNYQLEYSDDGVNFYYYKEPGQSSPKVFNGNNDLDSIVYHKLNPPIQAHYIRLKPTAWYGHISLRMELYGCSVPCTAALGMENRLIKDAQITASSEWDSNHAAIQGRLNFKEGGGKQGGWSARYNDANQWIQVALGSYTKLTGIATQGRNGGRHRQWVTNYQLEYSDDGVNFHYYKEPGQSSPKVFNGNKDLDSIVYHKLNPPIQAHYIRVRPTAWFGHISLRMELYGCLVPKVSRRRRDVGDHVNNVYSLAEDPLHLVRGKREEKRGKHLDKSGSSSIHLIALLVMCLACSAGTALMMFKKSRDKSTGYDVLVRGDQE